MATIKNIPDSYTINVPNMIVNGNLNVTGNTTNIYSTNLVVEDNIITLNGNVTGTPTLDAGIQINRGSAANVYLQWTEASKAWQITNDGSTFGNIVYSPNGNVTISSNLLIKTTTATPVATTGYNTIYSQTPGGGASGLYVTNTAITAQELATQSAEIKYAIIFG